MPRDPLAWLPLLRHWTHCLGEGPDAIPRMGDLGALPELDMAALLPGGPGWSDVQRSLRSAPLVKTATASDQRRLMAVLVDLETVCSGVSLASDR